MNRAREVIDQLHSPDGYNIGVNVAEAAGQTVQHAHIHLIPRYCNDVENPRGGVRSVIPYRSDYHVDQVSDRAVSYEVPLIRLPEMEGLAVDRLAQVFRDTRNSYKFYWFLAILRCVRQGSHTDLAWSELLPRMALLAAYPAVEHRLSLGRQDQLANLLEPYRGFKVAELESVLRDQALESLSALRRYVPQRFLRPWFREVVTGLPDSKVDRRIAELSRRPSAVSPAPYSVEAGFVRIHSAWLEYFQEHLSILESFTFWSLTVYLQGCNPNVPAIPNKLMEPTERSLSAATKRFWRPALARLASPRCIYSGLEVPARGFSLDHFLPWSFVAHDRLWNLIPTLKEVNSSKGDRLPELSHLKTFAEMHAHAYKIALERGEDQLLEDYLDIWPGVTPTEVSVLPKPEFEEGLRRVLTPLYQIASNSGFPSGWRFVTS